MAKAAWVAGALALLLLALGNANAVHGDELFAKTYRNSVEGNKAETIAVPAGYEAVEFFINISAGSGFWSDVRGYASATLLDPNGEARAHVFQFSVLPTVWYSYGALAYTATCGLPAVGPTPLCTYPLDGNPFHPYTFEASFVFPSMEGDWTLVYAHASASGIFTRVAMYGLTGEE